MDFCKESAGVVFLTGTGAAIGSISCEKTIDFCREMTGIAFSTGVGAAIGSVSCDTTAEC
jgi:hypothetical protein